MCFFFCSFWFTIKLSRTRRLPFLLPLCMHVSPTIKIPHHSGTFVTISEPTLTHRYHPKPMVYIRVQSCTFCGLWQIYNDICVITVLYRIASLPWKSPVLHLFILRSLWPLATVDLFTVYIFLPFLECHIIGITCHVAFSYWFISLSNVHLRFLYVFSRLDSSILFTTEKYSIA